MDGRAGTDSFDFAEGSSALRVDVAVVGGGISGLAAAFELLRRRPGLSLTVLEAESIPGGKVRSSSEQGYTFDWGPNGFAPADATLALVERLGLTGSLVPASPGARARYLYRDGGLRKVPVKPPEFLASELLSPVGKMRAALEPVICSRAGSRLLGSRHGRNDRRDETVYRFAERHFGREVAELAATLVLGITAGDARRLSVASLFPALHEMEKAHGSLVRAMLASRRKRAEAARGRGGATPVDTPAGTRAGRTAASGVPTSSSAPPPALYSFEGGLGVLTDALARRLGNAVRAGCAVKRLARSSDGAFELELESGSGERSGARRILANQVVLCTPAHVTAHLLEHLLPSAAAELAAIPYPDVDVFALGFNRIEVPSALDGFGFLVPRGEGVRSLGVLWSSALYPQRSPAGSVLLRVIAGGTHDPALPCLPDEDALAVVARDLRLTMGITAAPRFVRRLRIARAIPQYEQGHRERVDEALRGAREHGGVFLGGNALFGVGVNDCIRDAERIADELLG